MKNKFEHSSYEENVLAQAYERALSGRGQEQIDMERFVDDYGAENVAGDRQRVSDLEAKFEAEMTPEIREAIRLGTILEAIVVEQTELNEWFGPDVRTRKASRFDDVVNGVDAIAEIEREHSTSHLALAVDVTYGVLLQKKFDRIRHEIDDGTLATVKYFENTDETFRGRLRKVPRVVLGVEKQKVVELAELWTSGKQKELAVHPAQLQLLDEILVQLRSFAEYARGKGKDDLARVYEKQLGIVESMASHPRKEKLRREMKASGLYQRDQTEEAIRLGAKKLPAQGGLSGAHRR